jgi:hypothetical protein
MLKKSQHAVTSGNSLQIRNLSTSNRNDIDICFIYHELLNPVTILKCVSKMLNSEEDDDNENKK